MIRFVAQVGDHGQFFGLHLLRDLLQNAGARSLMRQRVDDDVAALRCPGRAHAQGAAARGVELRDVLRRGDDLGVAGEIRAFDDSAELGEGCFGSLQQANRGAHHLAQIVRGDVRGHAHRNPRGAVEQHIGRLRGQQGGLFQRAVEVRRPVHRTLTQFAEQPVGVGGQP